MGDSKRMSEIEERRRDMKISFVRSQAPVFFACELAGHRPESNLRSPENIVEMAATLFDEIEIAAKHIAVGNDTEI